MTVADAGETRQDDAQGRTQHRGGRDTRRLRFASLVVALAFLSASDILIPQAPETALDRYVNSKDPAYGWKLINTAHGEGEKYIRYVPNMRHNLGGSDARESLLTFYQSILANRPRPKFSWTRAADGSIRVDVTDRPTSVNLWQATNAKARDFRLDVIGAAYTSTTLMEESPGVYVAHVAKPAQGFTAFFVELFYDSGFRNPWKFTTEVSVVPDVLPFKWEDAKAKYPHPGRP